MHNKEYRPTLAQLRTFVTIAENKHFGTAATKLEISQPSLSQALVALEQGLGVQLIERSTRKVIVTATGEKLLPYAEATLEAADAFLAHARGAHGTLTGPPHHWRYPHDCAIYSPRAFGRAFGNISGLGAPIRGGTDGTPSRKTTRWTA